MAKRPVFMPTSSGRSLVVERLVEFPWHKGMAPSQGKKNVAELHARAGELGVSPLLEVSTRSDHLLGQRLSAFSLKVEFFGQTWALESLYQSAKVFRCGGPYEDIRGVDPRAAKADPRLKTSGDLVGFALADMFFAPTPPTAFYDWLYCLALLPHRAFVQSKMSLFVGFTDIAFNPERSVNCQARSCALVMSLQKRGRLDEGISSFEGFARVLREYEVIEVQNSSLLQASLL